MKLERWATWVETVRLKNAAEDVATSMLGPGNCTANVTDLDWSVQIRNFSTWRPGKASGFGVGIHHWYTHPNIGQWVHETSDTCYCRETAKRCDRYVCVALYGSVLYDFQQLKSMRSLMVPFDEWSLHHKLCASKAKDQVRLQILTK